MQVEIRAVLSAVDQNVFPVDPAQCAWGKRVHGVEGNEADELPGRSGEGIVGIVRQEDGPALDAWPEVGDQGLHAGVLAGWH